MVRRDLLFRLKPLIIKKVFPFIGLVTVLPALANANDGLGIATGDYCDSTKTHLQIEANGTIPATLQQKLGLYARLDCSQSDPVSNLTAELLDVLSQENVSVTKSTVTDSGYGVIKLALTTSESDDGEKQTVLVPVVLAERSEDTLNNIIGPIRITGEMVENETLKVQFPINMNALKSIRGRLQLKWLRDGQVIEGATRSRYRLTADDIGKRLSVEISILDDQKTLVLNKQSSPTTMVAMANYPPEIQNLTVDGDAILGEELIAIFDVIDRNPEDTDVSSEIIWLRDNMAIPNARGPRYTLTEDDLGRVIRVMVTPLSSDGQGGAQVSGKVEMLALAKPVEKQLVVLKPKTEDVAPEEKAPEIITDQDTPSAEKTEDVVMAPPPRPVVIQTESEDKGATPQVTVKPAADTAVVSETEDETSQETYLALAEGLSVVEGDDLTLKKITFTDTEIIKQSDLDAVIRKHRGAELSIDLIREILADLNSLYENNGYELSRALLPQQVIRDGMLRIQLVDAKVGAIVVEDAVRIDEDYILNRLGFTPGDSISLSLLENRIRLFNANNKTQLTTELSPGQHFGETDVFVKVTEPDFIELPTVSVNNHGSELSDWKQNSFTTTFNNVLRMDDEFSVSVSDGEGTRSRAFGLKLPLGINGANININRSDANTKIKSGPDATVGFRGSSNSTSLALSYPLIFNDEYSVYISAAVAHAYGDLVQPGDGAVLSKSNTEKFALSLPASWSNGLTTVSFSPTFSVIHTDTEIPPEENWMSKIEGDFALSQFINPQLTFNGRGKFLYTDAAAMINLPSENLTVGGPGSVRGYQPSEDSGYKGYFLSAELRSDMATWEGVELPSFMPSIQPSIFFDHVMAQSQYRKRSRGDFWSSAGVGLTIPALFDTFTFDAYWATPLDGSIHQAEKDAYSDDVIKFSLSAKINIDVFK